MSYDVYQPEIGSYWQVDKPKNHGEWGGIYGFTQIKRDQIGPGRFRVNSQGTYRLRPGEIFQIINLFSEPLSGIETQLLEVDIYCEGLHGILEFKDHAYIPLVNIVDASQLLVRYNFEEQSEDHMRQLKLI